MISSKEVIEYIKKNMDPLHYLSFFVAGSAPKSIAPKSDLDLIFVIKGEYKNQFFESLKCIMDKFLSKDNSAVYSFFRGPLKYQDKGLIHFVIYTEEGSDEFGNREQFKHELRETLKNFLNNGKVVNGKSIKFLLKKVDFTKRDDKFANHLVLKEKYAVLKNKGYIQFKEWKNTSRGWRLVKSKKYPNKFFRNYLINYFEKHLKSTCKSPSE